MRESLDTPRDHGGGVDAAALRYGGDRAAWLDLSTGINPARFEAKTALPADALTALPDHAAQTRLTDAARRFWGVPAGADILATPGASLAIAQIPHLRPPGRVQIDTPTYNEHAAAFDAAGWQMDSSSPDSLVAVHPNNPDGRLWDRGALTAPLCIIDESFCDPVPHLSHMPLATRPGTLILKSLGKFWGLAGLRLGFVIGDPALIAELRRRFGPWPVSGPALHIGAEALEDTDWADTQRRTLPTAAERLDGLIGAPLIGGTPLFRLYDVGDGADFQHRLAKHHIWSRVFPYNARWLRLGLPQGAGWDRLDRALT